MKGMEVGGEEFGEGRDPPCGYTFSLKSGPGVGVAGPWSA